MDPVTYLEGLESSLADRPDVQQCIRTAKESYLSRLWYELGEALLAAIRDEFVRLAANDIHKFVLLHCRTDISPFVYSKLLLVICLHPDCVIPPSTGDQSESTNATTTTPLELIDGALASVSCSSDSESTSSQQATKTILCIRALLLMATEATIEARRIVSDVSNYVATRQAHEIEPVLAATLAKAKVREYELLRQFDPFYTTSFVLHNACVKAEIPLLVEEVAQLAYKTAVAALLSDKLYNFGKLLTFQPFVDQLSTAPADSWLLQWCQLCNDGDVAAYEAFVSDNMTNNIQSIPDISNALPALAKKVRLMALLHLVFYSPADSRVFSFATIAERCGLSSDLRDVEPLLLTALSNNLIKGKIDGLAEVIDISWVQPRVLSASEISELSKLVGIFKNRVMEARKHVDSLVAKEANV